ncbi:MAG: hypothetical protein DMF78_03330 [Acidobacteria bacterium]|nr:MAG: hypothetical protein DMF78_03330 [Acidobacteriota bacterium]
MTGGADPRSLAPVWLEKAAGDLAAAQALLAGAAPPWTAAFHAQQCVEKCLKALLVAFELPFPKSHDIRGLLLLVPPDIGLTIDRRIAAELTESAVNSRYPFTEEPGVGHTSARRGGATRVRLGDRSPGCTSVSEQ